MDAAYELSRFLVDTRFSDLPTKAIDVVKREVLDILAVALGGSSDDTVRGLYELVEGWGGTPESRVIAHRGKFPAHNAVLVNSVMSNALDYDDTHEKGLIHAGSIVVPTAFAVAELKGGVNGKDFITAVCLSVELGSRLGIAAKHAKPVFMGGWSCPELYGYFSGTAAAGKILGLNEQMMHNALGIAYSQAAGNSEAIIEQAATKTIGYGLSSRAAITSALMAQKGLTGVKAVFDEKDLSFFNLYHAGCDREALLNGLGQEYEICNLSFKPYPACRMTHRFIDAIAGFVAENEEAAAEVEEVVPRVWREIHRLVCTPEEIKKRPNNSITAQQSLPWTLACALVRKRVGIKEFTDEALHDPALLDMAAKIKPVLDSSLPDQSASTIMTVTTRKGVFELKTSYAHGSAQNPMTFEEIEAKFMDCASFMSTPISKKNLKEVVSMVRNLEDVEAVERILQLLSPSE